MITKDKILDNCADFKKQGRNSTELRTFTELARLEVLIDIRDIIRHGLDDLDSAIHNISLRP